jgi:hypothetical protein
MSGISTFLNAVLLNYCFSEKIKNSGFMNCSWREDQRVSTGNISGSLETIPMFFSNISEWTMGPSGIFRRGGGMILCIWKSTEFVYF